MRVYGVSKKEIQHTSMETYLKDRENLEAKGFEFFHEDTDTPITQQDVDFWTNEFDHDTWS